MNQRVHNLAEALEDLGALKVLRVDDDGIVIATADSNKGIYTHVLTLEDVYVDEKVLRELGDHVVDLWNRDLEEPGKVFVAKYNSCVYESAFGVISIHKTREGAEKALEAHKRETLELMAQEEPEDWEVWKVTEEEILP